MRFLVDEALQKLVADRLMVPGHDATHVRALGMQGATDDDVLAHAAREQRVLVTTDTDFGAILALSGAPVPSVLLLRGVGDTVDERVNASPRRSPSSRTSWRPARSSSSRANASGYGRCRSPNDPPSSTLRP